jgi:hypothetical protein
MGKRPVLKAGLPVFYSDTIMDFKRPKMCKKSKLLVFKKRKNMFK